MVGAATLGATGLAATLVAGFATLLGATLFGAGRAAWGRGASFSTFRRVPALAGRAGVRPWPLAAAAFTGARSAGRFDLLFGVTIFSP